MAGWIYGKFMMDDGQFIMIDFNNYQKCIGDRNHKYSIRIKDLIESFLKQQPNLNEKKKEITS